MEVCYQGVGHFKFVAGVDKYSGVCADWVQDAAVVGGALDSTAGGCSDADDSAAFFLSLVNYFAGFFCYFDML